MSLKEFTIEALSCNPATMIGRQWMLITAGTQQTGYNTMTAAWGHLGAIWSRPGASGAMPTACIYIRPQRYTHEFVEREERFTLSFFPEDWKKQLAYLGAVSGRDENKIERAGLTPAFGDGTTWFQEASLVLVCRKLYRQQLREDCFLDPALVDRNYPARDFHTMYIGEIEKLLMQE